MTVQSYDLTHVGNGLLGRSVAWIQDRFTDFRVARMNAISLQQLEALSDRTLCDIGLNRSELTSVVYNRHDVTRVR